MECQQQFKRLCTHCSLGIGILVFVGDFCKSCRRFGSKSRSIKEASDSVTPNPVQEQNATIFLVFDLCKCVFFRFGPAFVFEDFGLLFV